MVAPCSNICITKHLIWKEKREEIIKGWQSIPMNYHLNRNISYILPIIDLIKMKEKIQIAKMRAVLLYIMQCFPHGVEFIKLFKILYFAQQDHLLKYGKVLIEDSFKALKHGPVPTYIYKALQIAKRMQLEGNFDEFLINIKVHDKKVYTSATPNMDYISGSNRRCLDDAIAQYKDITSDMLHDSAWEEVMTCIPDAPQKNCITIIDIARAGKATKEMVDYIREKQIVKNALS